MTRMIERWFPCTEVSEASRVGWGSGISEKALFTWFAARPLGQAKAAVLTSLLPWPDDETEQRRLQDLVRRAMKDRDGASSEIVAELKGTYPSGASMLDPFSGRAMIPLEAARLGVTTYGIDYSPVASLAGSLLADYPLRDWSAEPELPFGEETLDVAGRLLIDVRQVLDEIGRRYAHVMSDAYPKHDGTQPWGYLWATTLPCQECGRRFPLTGSLVLRHPLPVKNDAGQSYRIDVDREAGTFHATVHDGPPTGQPTLVATVKAGKAVRGKSAVCPFCEHVHPKALHTRLAAEGFGQDVLMVAADIDQTVAKFFREPTDVEMSAADGAAKALSLEPDFAPLLSAVPAERIPEGNNDTVRASAYGAKSYGDLCNARQTLGFVRLCRVIADMGSELVTKHGVSHDYAAALTGYAASVLVRKIKYSTRGSVLQARTGTKGIYVDHVFVNEASLAFNYDYFEVGIGDGPATWKSLTRDTLNTLRKQVRHTDSRPADISRGTAVELPMKDASLTAVVTDPPYDNMIDYSDASDLFYVWLKRALNSTHPWFGFTTDPNGVQEKAEEIIVKRGGTANHDHRTREHYDSMIAKAFSEARRVVQADGVVTIVFGHGDPEVWHRLLGAITSAGLVLTGSWPAKTESGGSAGSANIVTTLTMSCRPAPPNRQPGRANLVEAEVKREVKARVPMWEKAGLAPTDQLMASAGPAMEVVGRYSEVIDNLGEPVEPDRYLLVARRAIEEAASIEVDHLPLETFDARTRFALSWARLYGRGVAAKSEARWQALASDLDLDALKGVLVEADKGVRLSPAVGHKAEIDATSAVVDVALAMAKAWPEGLDAVGEVLAASQRSLDDPYLWAAMSFLSSKLPEADPDAVAWTGLVRAKRGIGAATREVVTNKKRADEDADGRLRQGNLFEQLDLKVEGQLDLTDEGEVQ
jgi:adenine-specific DNA methylase